jgi:uncharacterized protein
MVMESEEAFNFEDIYKKLKVENATLADKFRSLSESIAQYQSAIVAFSGGVDSALLAYLTSRLVLRTLCVTADSPTLPRSELNEARTFAEKFNLTLRVIPHNELEDERFAINDEKRCYYCKDGLFSKLTEIMKKEGYDCVFDGSNFDDLDDYRPGREAAKKNNVKSPLLESEMGKEDIRKVSKVLGLPTWDKPQMACLSSRFPRNMEIRQEDLKRVEEAEEIVKALGYRDVRVRYHSDIARIELGANEAVDMDKLGSAVQKIKALGFRFVALDLEGYRMGSLNE